MQKYYKLYETHIFIEVHLLNHCLKEKTLRNLIFYQIILSSILVHDKINVINLLHILAYFILFLEIEESKMKIYKMRSEQFDPIHNPETIFSPEKETTFDGRNESQHIIVKKISIRKWCWVYSPLDHEFIGKLVKMKPLDLEEDS